MTAKRCWGFALRAPTYDLSRVITKGVGLIEVIALIVGVVGLLPVYFLVREKLVRKRYTLELDYKNIIITMFSDPQNSKLDGRLCIVFYVLRVVNISDRPTTLKAITISYKHGGHNYQDESYVVPTGVPTKAEKPAIALYNDNDSIVLMNWENVRTKLGEHEALQAYGIFSGSAVFLFEPHIEDIQDIADLSLVVSDFSGYQSVHPLSINSDWLGPFKKGFRVMNRPFIVAGDGSIQWT